VVSPASCSGSTYFLGFPKELEETARVDGLGHWGAYWRAVVPNSLYFFAAIATTTFTNGWDAFRWPLAIGQDPSAWTVQVALSSYTTNQTVDHHLILVATAISSCLCCAFLFVRRRLGRGSRRRASRAELGDR
jgi:multiple sugar transport system permease protein